jgi:hypothetical protein
MHNLIRHKQREKWRSICEIPSDRTEVDNTESKSSVPRKV